MLQRSCIVLVSLMLSVSAWAQEERVPSDFDAVLISPIESEKGINPNDLTITYDPAELRDAPNVDLKYADLIRLSDEMTTPDFQKQMTEKVIIPVSSSLKDKVALAENLTPEELVTFVSKKTKFLSGIAKTLSFIHLKPSAINKVIFTINDQFFFKNAGVVANANTRVTNLQFGIGGGIGLADWMMKQLKKSSYFKDLPDRTGFYFMAGAGVSIGRRVQADGSSRFFIEPIVEFRRSTRIFSPFVFGAMGFTGSHTWENRTGQDAIQTATFYKVSTANVMSGTQMAGVAAAAAMVFPPGGGAVAGIEGEVYRVRLTHEIFTTVWSKLRDFTARFSGGRMKCSNVF